MPRQLLLGCCLALAILLPACKAPAKKAKAPVTAVNSATASKVQDLYYQGVYAYGGGDTAAAMALWKKALALNPRHQPTLDAMAEARGKMKALDALKKK